MKPPERFVRDTFKTFTKIRHLKSRIHEDVEIGRWSLYQGKGHAASTRDGDDAVLKNHDARAMDRWQYDATPDSEEGI